jgi:hypothetical protein
VPIIKITEASLDERGRSLIIITLRDVGFRFSSIPRSDLKVTTTAHLPSIDLFYFFIDSQKALTKLEQLDWHRRVAW